MDSKSEREGLRILSATLIRREKELEFWATSKGVIILQDFGEQGYQIYTEFTGHLGHFLRGEDKS